MKSLTDRIRAAQNADEINSLLKKGQEYEFATKKTRSKWVKVANARRNNIANNR